MKHVCLIDGSGFMHRAKAMAQPVERNGMDIGVAILFAKMFRKVTRRAYAGKHPPTHWAVCFDPPRTDSWRRKRYAGYKANREETDEAFKAQVPFMKACCAEAGFKVITAAEHEADDLLAAYGMDAHNAGHKVTLVSSDKDLMQLVRPRMLMWDARSDVWFNAKAVEEKFGLPPKQLGDYLALAGDVADGIPGAKGIGPKAAVGILSGGRSLAQVLKDPSVIENKRWRKLIEENIEELNMARMLVSLDVAQCPRPYSFDELYLEEPERIEGLIDIWIKEAYDGTVKGLEE